MSRVRPESGPTVSLFPFLAVLLCTMGALLVLLVLFSRSAKESERAAAEASQRQQEEELLLAQEQLAWRLRQLQDVRDRTQADLSRARMQLAGIEDDARTLADELEQLERTAVALADDARPDPADEESLRELERRLTSARESLDKARKDQASRPAAYAVVPYEGANGTHRRPLYIECCIDGVFLQPEGIRLGPSDFEGPPGPGNPLASALRAAREHLARGPAESGDPAAQPYPLLLVRPSGVMAYYAARESIQSWGSEFGYQFIDEDWTLNFPPRDPALAEAESRAVEESRRRMAWLGEVRKARPARPAQQYRASTTRGGVVAEGGPSVLGDQSRFDWTEEQAAAGQQGGPGRGFTPVDAAAANAAGGLAADGAGGGDVILGGTAAGSSGTGVGTGTGGKGTGEDAGVPGSGSGGPVPGGADGGLGNRYAGPSKFYSGSSDAGAAGGAGGSASAGDSAATPGSSAAGSGGAAGSGATGAVAGGSPGGGKAMPQGAAGGGGGLGPSMPGLAQPGQSGAAVSMTGASGGSSASASLAGKRGSNWASLATNDRPIPLRRPIRVECAASELRVLADGGSRVESRIPLGTETAESVDLLVTAVHAKVGRWGIAGDRMYWKPELVLSETADGRGRREDLERLLADSGLDTRRTGEYRADIRPLPPVERTSRTVPAR